MSAPLNIKLPPGGVVIGIGADLIEVERIRGVIERHGQRFLDRILTDDEKAYCAGMGAPHKHIAARFAAKEAISKCFTTGIGKEFGWKSASVYHGSRHEPLVPLDEQGQALLAHVGGTNVLLSLSHTESHALAVAVLVRG